MNEIKLIYNFIKDKKGIMFDVGAMNGCSSLQFARTGWSVYAFEPNPEQRGIFERTVKLEKLDNLRIESYAIGNKNKKNQPFFLSSESKGISSLVPFHPSHKQTYYVDLVRLDDYIRRNKIEHIDFLKIDTEGYDYFVLQSYPWELDKPEIILCEFEDNKTKDSLRYRWCDMVHFLKKKGYFIIVSEWFPIVQYGEEHQWRCFKKYPCQLEDENGWGNLLAFNNLKLFHEFCKTIHLQ